MRAAADEGVPDFVLNARTDAFLQGRRPRPGRGAWPTRSSAAAPTSTPAHRWSSCPGGLAEEQVAALVEAFGPQRLTLLAVPGCPSLARLEELGVARVCFGPFPQRVALTALQQMVEGVGRGEGIPEGTRSL